MTFLPRCMECGRGLAMRILSVLLSVCVCQSVFLSNACIVTKRKKDLSRFFNHTKDHLGGRFWLLKVKNNLLQLKLCSFATIQLVR